MEKKVKQLKVKVEGIKQIKKDIFLLNFFSSQIAKTAIPGNFLHLRIDPDLILRRPLSIHKIVDKQVYLLFRVRGRGTDLLSRYKKGDILDIIGPLGRGFSRISQKGESKIIIAGGMGVAPMVFLAQRLKAACNKHEAVQGLILLGAANKKEILCEDDFKKLGYKVHSATEDGSKGFKGRVTGLLKKILSTNRYQLLADIYACGPGEMFFEINKILKKYPLIDCEVSFEQFMGCGLGICCGCVIKTKAGYKKVCKDGPVFDLKEIW